MGRLGGLDYADDKIYKAMIAQSGISNPTASILQNGFPITPIWTRVSQGLYRTDFLYQMSIQFLKQLFALFLLALTILFTVVAINENNYTYLLGTVISAIVSYLLIKKKI